MACGPVITLLVMSPKLVLDAVDKYQDHDPQPCLEKKESTKNRFTSFCTDTASPSGALLSALFGSSDVVLGY